MRSYLYGYTFKNSVSLYMISKAHIVCPRWDILSGTYENVNR